MLRPGYRTLKLLAMVYAFLGIVGLVVAVLVFLGGFSPTGNIFASLAQAVPIAVAALLLLGLYDAIRLGFEILERLRRLTPDVKP